jgi:hypothetical protein
MEDQLPATCAYRLGQALGRERAQVDARLVTTARRLSPVYLFIPPVLLRQRIHEITGTMLRALSDANFAPFRAYLQRTAQLGRALGRSPDLLNAMGDAWEQILLELATAECGDDRAW